MSIIRDIPINHPIHCVYFYYLKFPDSEEQQQGPEIRAYYYFEESEPIRDEVDLRRILKMLGRNAGIKDYAPPPFDANETPWRRRSYLAVLVDGPSHALSDVRDIVINFEDGVEEFSHSFFNARLMEIDMSVDNSGALINVFHCVNLMRHRSGRDMHDGEREPYHLSFRPTGELRLLDDDGGTNQGGPIPPFTDYAVSEEWRG